MLHFFLALAVSPLLAQDFAITGSDGIITAVPLQTPDAVQHANLPFRELGLIEDAFYRGSLSLDMLVRRVNRLPGGGGFEWIEEHGYDPREFTDPKVRVGLSAVIEALDYDTRLSNLINDINAAIADEEKRFQQPKQAARDKAWQDADEESRIRARTFYPDIYFPDSRLSKKWVEVYAQMQKDGTLPKTPDAFFVITVRAENLLGIKPVFP
jgi:hypothetical protein